MTEGQSSFRTIATRTECSEANGSTYLTREVLRNRSLGSGRAWWSDLPYTRVSPSHSREKRVSDVVCESSLITSTLSSALPTVSEENRFVTEGGQPGVYYGTDEIKLLAAVVKI